MLEFDAASTSENGENDNEDEFEKLFTTHKFLVVEDANSG